MNILEVEGVRPCEQDLTNEHGTTPAQQLAWFTLETLRLQGTHARRTCPGLTPLEYGYAAQLAKRNEIESTHFTDYLGRLSGAAPKEFTDNKLLRMYVAKSPDLTKDEIRINYQLHVPEQVPGVINIAKLILYKGSPNVIATFENCRFEGQGNLALAHTAIAALQEDADEFRRYVLDRPYENS